MRLFLLCCLLAVVSGARLHNSSPTPASPRSRHFSSMRPHARYLRWDEDADRTPGGIADGTLNVKLDPNDPDSPHLMLRVRMVFSSIQPAPKGNLLIHYGGPGSGASSLSSYAAVDGYDTWMISQRGIGNGANPALKCQNHSHLPTKTKGPYQISDFTDCPCALLDDTPMIGETWANIDPKSESQVEHLLTLMSKWGKRCYDSPKFQLEGKNGRTYNLLDYVGTQYLAYDIELMRKAVGARNISCHGYSYGTYVCGVYATVFSSKVGRLVMDGNMDPMPQKEMLTSGDAQQNDKAVAKMISNCAEQSDKCSLKNPEKEYTEILEDIRAGKLTARTASGKAYPLQVGMLVGWLQAEFGSNTGRGWAQVTKLLGKLSRASDYARRTEGVEYLLNGFCRVKGRATWYHYDICVGPGQTHEDEEEEDPDTHEEVDILGETYIEQNAVWGADMAGFYRVDDTMRLWRTAVERYGDAGIGAFAANLAGSFFWPSTASPTPPIGNSKIEALIVGNLFDPSTGYSGSQEMRRAFPNGALVTWQGVGHVLPHRGYSYDPNATDHCNNFVEDYLSEGTLPLDGVICKQTVPIPVA